MGIFDQRRRNRRLGPCDNNENVLVLLFLGQKQTWNNFPDAAVEEIIG